MVLWKSQSNFDIWKDFGTYQSTNVNIWVIKGDYLRVELDLSTGSHDLI